MSKSLKRVKAALAAAGVTSDVMEMPGETRTAAQAAEAAGCDIDQIAKSIIFQGGGTGQIYLFVTAGGNQVDPDKAAALAGEPMVRADAGVVRSVTGFAIGGVSPVGHMTAVPVFMDKRLMDFATVWGAAGTPRHIFPIDPGELSKILDVEPTVFTS